MKKFRLIADFTFEAEDLDNACALLAYHFAESFDNDLGEIGTMSLEEVK